MSPIRPVEEFLEAHDGTRLFLRRSALNSPRRLLVLHGLFEHSINYAALMARLFPEGGVSWVALDFRGHGRSEGAPNQVDSAQYASDIQSVLDHLGWQEGSFVGLAHSFGALTALYLSAFKPHFFKALALTSPFLGMPDSRSSSEAAILKALSFVLPGFRLKDPIETKYLTHDLERIRQYKTDPLIHLAIPLKSLRNILKMQSVACGLHTLPIPVLVLAGSGERIVSRKAIRRWIDEYRGERLEKKMLDGYYHEIFNEPDNEPAIQTVRKYLKDVL